MEEQNLGLSSETLSSFNLIKTFSPSKTTSSRSSSRRCFPAPRGSRRPGGTWTGSSRARWRPSGRRPPPTRKVSEEEDDLCSGTRPIVQFCSIKVEQSDSEVISGLLVKSLATRLGPVKPVLRKWNFYVLGSRSHLHSLPISPPLTSGMQLKTRGKFSK